MKKVFTKQLIEAAIWTFLETFLAVLAPAVAATSTLDMNWNTLGAMTVAAGIAALSAVFSAVKSYIIKNMGAVGSIFLTTGVVEEDINDSE